MHSWPSIRLGTLCALLSASVTCGSQPIPAAIKGSPGSVVELSGSASPDSAASDFLPVSACSVGDLVFWPEGAARPWPVVCAAASIPHQLKAPGAGTQVALSGSLLIPTDQVPGRTVTGEVNGYVTVAYRTSSVIKEIFGPGEFATRRASIRYPLNVQVVSGRGADAPAGLRALDSLLRELPTQCLKYLRTKIDDKERFWRLALMLVAAPRGLPVPGTGPDCVH